MKTKFLFLAGIFLFFISLSPVAAQNENAERNRLEAIVRVFFNTNKDILTGVSTKDAINRSSEAEALGRGKKKGFELSETIASKLSLDGVTFERGKILNVDYLDVSINGNEATVDANVNYEMHYAKELQVPAPSVRNESYRFSFVKEKNKWIMTEGEFLPPLVMMWQNLSDNDRDSLRQMNGSSPKPEGGVEELKKGKNPNPRSRTRPPRSGNGNNDRGPNGAHLWYAPFLTTYDYNAAADYATRHAKSYNSDYRRYTNDCTNFISQCLAAGGWTEVDNGDRKSNGSWYYGSFTFTTSYTWAAANNHLNFHMNSGRSFHSSYASDMMLGDIMSVDYLGPGYSYTDPIDGVPDHTVIVHYKSPYGNSESHLYLAYHTSDNYYISITEFKERIRGTNGYRLWPRLMYHSF